MYRQPLLRHFHAHIPRCSLARRGWHGTRSTNKRPSNIRSSAVLLGTLASFYLISSSQVIEAEETPNVETPRSTLPLSLTPAIDHDISDGNIQAARKEFVGIVGEDGIDDVQGDLEARSSTEWSPAPTDQLVSLILLPQSTEQISEIMKICTRRRIPVTAFSGGTSLDGALATTRGGIIVDTSKLNKIIAIRPGDLDVTVQSAVGWEALNEELAKQDLFFPPDPGPGAEIGGMISTGCSGTNAYRYGPMKDWVISCTVVLADGTIVKTRRRPRKSTAGYDLARLIVGASGTLGIVTEATLKLTSVPRNLQVAVVPFPSTHKAVQAASQMIQRGIQIEAMELMDEVSMRAANESGYTDVEYSEAPTLFLKFAGPSPAAVTKQLADVEALMKANKCTEFRASKDPDEIEGLWGARKTILWNIIALKEDPSDAIISCDVAVPISHLADAIEDAKKTASGSGLTVSTLGHVGDSNFHATVLHSPDKKELAEKIIMHIRRKGIELEGTITGEHGIGMALRDLLTEEVGEDATDMMRRIKFALDPLCILGCDKVIRVEKSKAGE